MAGVYIFMRRQCSDEEAFISSMLEMGNVFFEVSVSPFLNYKILE